MKLNFFHIKFHTVNCNIETHYHLIVISFITIDLLSYAQVFIDDNDINLLNSVNAMESNFCFSVEFTFCRFDWLISQWNSNWFELRMHQKFTVIHIDVFSNNSCFEWNDVIKPSGQYQVYCPKISLHFFFNLRNFLCH